MLPVYGMNQCESVLRKPIVGSGDDNCEKNVLLDGHWTEIQYA